MLPGDILLLESKEAWREWLEVNCLSSPGAWLQMAKKGTPFHTLSYSEALECALCYGWIDGQKRSGPDGYFLQRFTRRTARSIWSKINREKALDLMETEQMRPPGFAAVEQAKKNGLWDAAYDAQSAIRVPDDLVEALTSNPRASNFFQRLSSQNRYAILFRLQKIKNPVTRANNIIKYVAMLESGETFHPQKSGSAGQGR
jgi:uncharacterized protein YdeI (YjbR/CyaY-like superfamily)